MTGRSSWVALIAAASLAACARLDLGAGPVPTPTGAPTAQPSPGVCNTPDANNPNLVIVAMGSAISPVASPPYGAIGGYSVADLSTGEFPTQAMLINATLPAGGAAITSQNVIQFTNVENNGTTTINHSAVGFKGDAFPGTPYAFPSPAASPLGTTIASAASWSTGRVAPSVTQQCYSREFSLKPGTYFFGDYDFYNLGTFRDVLVVGTPRPQSHRGKMSRTGRSRAPGRSIRRLRIVH